MVYLLLGIVKYFVSGAVWWRLKSGMVSLANLGFMRMLMEVLLVLVNLVC